MVTTRFLKISFFLLFSLIATQSNGQQLHRQMLSSTGGTFITNTGLVVLQTISQQSVVGTTLVSDLVMQQGFQQSLLSTYFPLTSINKITTSVYPNPFKNRITINFSELVPGDMTIDLYNMFGVITHKYRVKDTPLTMSYDFGELPSGSYVLQIKAPNYTFTKTLIKQ
jgi:hypothetical protein